MKAMNLKTKGLAGLFSMKRLLAFIFVSLISLISCKKDAVSKAADEGVTLHLISGKKKCLIVGPIVNTNDRAKEQGDLMNRVRRTVKQPSNIQSWSQLEIDIAFMDIRNAYVAASKNEQVELLDFQRMVNAQQRKLDGLSTRSYRDALKILMRDAEAQVKAFENELAIVSKKKANLIDHTAIAHDYSYALYTVKLAVDMTSKKEDHIILNGLLTNLKSTKSEFDKRYNSEEDRKQVKEWVIQNRKRGGSLFEIPYAIYSRYKALGLLITDISMDVF